MGPPVRDPEPSHRHLVLAGTFYELTLTSAFPPKIGSAVVSNETSPTSNIGRASLKQARNSPYRFNGARSVYRTYLKYGVPAPEHIVKAVDHTDALYYSSTKRSTGTASAVPIDPSVDMAFIPPKTIGTPHTPPSQIPGQEIYRPNKSGTAKLLDGHTCSITHSDGPASRGTCTRILSRRAGFWQPKYSQPEKPVDAFEDVKKGLDRQVLKAHLKYRKAGAYDFGFIDQTKYTGEITYVPVNAYLSCWTFTSSAYGVGEGNFIATSITGIADTGTSLVYLPSSILTAYYRQVKGTTNSRYYGGYASVAPESSTCFDGLQSSSGLGINIWGDVALKAAFVVFDGDEPPPVGWASKPLKE
ncbi:hypothetical protein VTI74DRAFT_4625 [Chaetomium olivicolor]